MKNAQNRNDTKLWLISTVILAAVFVAFKISYLNQACNGDEAYPYSAAIDYMVNHDLSISPKAIPVELSKGHPLLFHFLQAGWMKLFGREMWVARLFPLLLSVLVLFRVFFFGKKFFSPAIGFFCALMLASRSIFFVQSSFILPEVLLTLLLLTTIQFYLEKKWIYYCITGSVLVLTKEPALIFIGIFGLFELAENFKLKNSLLKFGKNLFLTGIPILAAGSFYIWQKIEMGWFFYPEHIGYFTFVFRNFYDKLFVLYGGSIFIFYGGVFILASTILFFILNLIKKNKISSEAKKTEILLLILILSYLIFGALNFASPRYMLCLYPLFFFLTISQIFKFFRQKEKWAAVISICLVGINIGYLVDIRANGDCDLRSADMTEVRKEVIEYCKEKGWKTKKIFAPFFMGYEMSSASTGYLKKTDLFDSVSSYTTSDPEIFIIPSDEKYPTHNDVWKLDLKLLKRFEKNGYSIEIRQKSF